MQQAAVPSARRREELQASRRWGADSRARDDLIQDRVASGIRCCAANFLAGCRTDNHACIRIEVADEQTLWEQGGNCAGWYLHWREGRRGDRWP